MPTIRDKMSASAQDLLLGLSRAKTLRQIIATTFLLTLA